MLPTLTLADIPRSIVTTDSETRSVRKTKAMFFDQPTNGISYIRMKADLKNLPDHLRPFLPMFREMLPSIGTENFSYDVFDNKVLRCSSGLKAELDRF